MNTYHNENVAQEENENVQPVEKQIDKFKSHYYQHFETTRFLGKGAFGIVFAARNILDDGIYAIKRIPFPSRLKTWLRSTTGEYQLNGLALLHIHRDINVNIDNIIIRFAKQKKAYAFIIIIFYRQESRDCVLREVQALAKLEDENIVKYFNAWLEEPPRSWQEEQDKKLMPKSDDMDTSSNITTSPTDTTSDSYSERKATLQYLYIQMELCQEYSLKEILKDNNNNDRDNMINIFCQIVKGVEYIHSKEFIHRDLKPSNILFGSNGQIKIGDFGSVTKMIKSDIGYEYDDKQKNFNEKHTDQVGTHLYMSPEQIHGKPYNFKVDIYSLGIIFFEMLNYFNTEMERCETLKQIRNGSFPPQFLKSFNLQIEKEVVCLMLSQDPIKRPTASMILQYLDNYDHLFPDSCPF